MVERRRHGSWRVAGRFAGDTPGFGGITDSGQRLPVHYVLDLWFQKKWRKREVNGDTIIVRYADDFVVGFQHKRDAERFLEAARQRFESFDLALHPDKTRLIEFGRFAQERRQQRGRGRPETFDFLGFTHYCTKDRKGQFLVGRKPVAKRMSRTLKRIKEALRGRMHANVEDTARWLGKVLGGWLNYYAVPGSYRYLYRFVQRLKRLWLTVLRRRSQKIASSGRGSVGSPSDTGRKWKSDTCGQNNVLPSVHYRVPPKGGAGCLNGHVRICAGGAGQPASLPR